ncbi:MAG TPA: VWA domain-containing protein [Actinomycetota bacterium]|jgi:Ca-activated chloride channel homolog|nr:VWA domain-containing protein [Actinomycetota bacterium]
MSFAAPNALYALALVPLIVIALVVAQRRRVRYAVRYPALDVLARVAGEVPRWRRYLPAAMFLLALAALLVGTAKPTARVPVPRDEATVMLVLDVSGSMDADDVEPNRLEAARAAASRFVDKLPERFQVGLVTFSDAADTLVQPTTDRVAVEQALASLRADGATAIGDGLGAALDAIEALGNPPAQAGADPAGPAARRVPAVTLLLSDGANTSGSDPLRQAERARQLDVPVFTISLGTPGGVLRGPGGQSRSVAPDAETLTRIADVTNARSFQAATSENLSAVYDGLGSRIGFRTEVREVTVAFAAAGLVLLLLAGILRSRWIARLP